MTNKKTVSHIFNPIHNDIFNFDDNDIFSPSCNIGCCIEPINFDIDNLSYLLENGNNN